MNEEAVRGLLAQQQAAAEQRFQEQMRGIQDQQAQMQVQLQGQLMEAQTRAAVAERDAMTLREVMVQRQSAPLHQTDDERELKSVIDIKILEKLEVFNGDDTRWESWLTGFEALTGLVGMDDLMVTSAQPGVTLLDCQLAQLAP